MHSIHFWLQTAAIVTVGEKEAKAELLNAFI